jgi:predicted RNA-binding Zn-ribbon protein involved in translation (DUF1610 family)
MIITNYFKNITEYLKLGKEIYISPIYGCKSCGYEGMLHRHGYYSRNVITKHYIKRINILRVKCPSCGKTHAILPSFLIPYYQYSLECIFECIYMSFAFKNSYSQIVDCFRALNPSLFLNSSNISSFRKRMTENKAITNSFFANFDDLYHDMNNPSISSILDKIKNFPKDILDFNFFFSKIMPRYFFSKS